MQEVSFVEFRKHLSDYVGQARFADERIAVTHHGKVVGGFVPLEDLRVLEALEMEQDCKDFDCAMKRYEKSGCKTISHEESLRNIES